MTFSLLTGGLSPAVAQPGTDPAPPPITIGAAAALQPVGEFESGLSDPSAVVVAQPDALAVWRLDPDGGGVSRWLATAGAAPVELSFVPARLALSPAGDFLALAGPDEVTLWDAAQTRVGRWSTPGGPAQALAVSSGGARVAAALGDEVLLWSGADDPQVLALPEPAQALALAPQAPLLAAIEPGGALSVWYIGADEPRELVRWTSLPSPADAVTFSPDLVLVTGHRDGSVTVGNCFEGPVTFLSGHQDAIRSVVFSPDGTHLAATDAAGTVRLWALPPAERPDLLAVAVENARAANARDLARYMATIHPESSTYGRTEGEMAAQFEVGDQIVMLESVEFVQRSETSLAVRAAQTIYSMAYARPSVLNRQIHLHLLVADGDQSKIYRTLVEDYQMFE